MKGICKALATLILILGAIGSFLLARGSGHWLISVTIFIASFLSVLVLSVILYSIDEILGRQEELSKGLKALTYQLQNPEAALYEKEHDKNTWKCPKCGKLNANYTGTCGCGSSKAD